MEYLKDKIGEKYDIGDFTYGNPIIYDYRSNTGLTIGKFCSIASGVKLFLGLNHHTE